MQEDAQLRERLRRVRLLMLDVDGVQTDGGLYYTESGEELRRFNVRDGLGIQRVMAAGLPVAFLTRSKTPCIAARAARLGITRCFDGVSDKITAAKVFCGELQTDLAEAAYMGDDLNDLNLMRVVGFPATVADAVAEIANVAVWHSSRPGGRGAVRELCDLLTAVNAKV